MRRPSSVATHKTAGGLRLRAATRDKRATAGRFNGCELRFTTIAVACLVVFVRYGDAQHGHGRRRIVADIIGSVAGVPVPVEIRQRFSFLGRICYQLVGGLLVAVL